MTTVARMNSRRRLVVQNLAIVYGAQIISMILSILPIAYLPVYLNAVGMGQLTIAESMATVLGTLIILGTGNYIVREIARDHDQLSTILCNSIVLRALIATLLSPVVVMLPRILDYPEQTRVVILLIYVALIVRMISEPAGLALQATGKMGWRSTATIVWKLIMVGLGWLVLVRGGGVIAFAVVFIVANFAEATINVCYLMIVTRVRWLIRYQALKDICWGGLPFFMWVFLQTAYQQTSGLMLGRLGGEVATGWYATAMQFVLPLYGLPYLAINVLLPQFAQIQVQSEIEFRQAVSRSLNYIFLFTLPAAVGLMLLAGRVIDLFNYPATFQRSVPVLQLLAISVPFTAVTMVIATGVSAMRRERTWAVVSLCSLIALIILNLILIPICGNLLQNAAIGAAAALVLAELVTIGAAWRLFGQSMIGDGFFTVLGRTLVAASTMALVVWSTLQLPIAVPIVLGALTYGSVVLLTKAIPEDDLQAIYVVVEPRLRPVVVALRRVLRRFR